MVAERAIERRWPARAANAGIVGVWISGGHRFGETYLLSRIKLRHITGLPADGIALTVLAMAIILFAVFYELNGGYHTERTVAAPYFSLPAVSGNPSNAAKYGALQLRL